MHDSIRCSAHSLSSQLNQPQSVVNLFLFTKKRRKTACDRARDFILKSQKTHPHDEETENRVLFLYIFTLFFSVIVVAAALDRRV